jgi:hypothetical protein
MSDLINHLEELRVHFIKIHPYQKKKLEHYWIFTL